MLKRMNSMLVGLLVFGCQVGMVSHPGVADETEGPHLTEQEVAAGFVPLFNGQTFEGWEGDLQWFKIEHGEIVAGSLEKKIPNNFFLCTVDHYADFELRLDAKLTGAGDNAGIQFRTERIPNHHEVSGYQADMGSAWERPVWGALYDESRRNKLLAEGDREKVPQVLRKDDWNDIVIRCKGPHVEIWLNGLKTVDYTESDATIATTGVIAVQIHGGAPAEARYRNLRIKKE